MCKSGSTSLEGICVDMVPLINEIRSSVEEQDCKEGAFLIQRKM